ncbi:MAG: glycoside hydrolase family 5 protein [Myxococcota bacterium]
MWFFLLLLAFLFGQPCVPGLPPGHEGTDFRLPALHAELDPEEGGRIHDALGRQVVLRGVNVNAFVEYWQYDPEIFTTYPFTPEDADMIAGMGWNAVRLLFSWSRVEPEPGVYDDAYLDELADAVRLLESRGVYTILDAHQDAWGPSLAAADDEVCPDNAPPAFGWDGAPAWATLDGGAERCALAGTRELSPAVAAAFTAFWEDAPGPGGVGIRTRFIRMWAHVVERFAQMDAVAGYNVMNEPNELVFVGPAVALTELYEAILPEIRAAEEAVGAPRRLFFFEPSILWNDFGIGVPLPFGDDQMVYAPHLYQGGLNDGPLDEALFQKTRDEAATFGGVPVLTGEWGSDPRRAEDPEDDYFERHLALQDRFGFGSTQWTWREACGDAHKAEPVRNGEIPYVWGFFEVDCAVNQTTGLREALIESVRRPLVRAAPGRLDAVEWDPAAETLVVRGHDAPRKSSFLVFHPADPRERLEIVSEGLFGVHSRRAPHGGRYLAGWTHGGPWELSVAPD